MKLHKDNNPFTQVPNELLTSKKITLKAKGLYSFMATKPNNYNFTIKSISSQVREGAGTVRVALQELREFGWISYFKEPNGSGIYTLHWTAACVTTPGVKNPHVEKAIVQKVTRINKIDPIINKSNNNKSLERYEKLRTFYPRGGFTPGEAVKQKFLALTLDEQYTVLHLAEEQLNKGVSLTYSALLIKIVGEGPQMHVPFHNTPS